eukprot:403344246
MDILSLEQAFTYSKPNNTNIACIKRNYDITNQLENQSDFQSELSQSPYKKHNRQISYDTSGELMTFSQFLEITHKIDKGQPIFDVDRAKNKTFVLQGYVPPKSDCQYNCFFADIGDDTSSKQGSGSEDNIAFSIVVSKFHQNQTEQFRSSRLKQAFPSKRSMADDYEQNLILRGSKRDSTVNKKHRFIKDSESLFSQLSQNANEPKQIKDSNQVPIATPKISISRRDKNQDKTISILQQQINGNESDYGGVLTNICSSPKFQMTQDTRLNHEDDRISQNESFQKKRIRPQTAKATQKSNLLTSMNSRVYTNRKVKPERDEMSQLTKTHQIDRNCRHSLISKLSQQNLVDDQECSQTRQSMNQQVKDIKMLNSQISLLDQTSQKNEINFFAQISDMHEDLQEKHDQLKQQGKKQKKIQKEKFDNEIQVLQYKILMENNLKDQHYIDMVKEEEMIQKLQMQFKIAQSEVQSVQDKLKNEQQMFSERLDKLKDQKESAAFQSTQIQNAISSKIIEAMQLKLDNNKLFQDLQVERQNYERIEKIKSLEKDYREEITYYILMSLIQSDNRSNGENSKEKVPVINKNYKNQVKNIRKRNNAINNEVELLGLQCIQNSNQPQTENGLGNTIDQVKLAQSKMKNQKQSRKSLQQ